MEHRKRSIMQYKVEMSTLLKIVIADTALELYKMGHLPVLGEWFALPLIEAAGSKEVGDKIWAGEKKSKNWFHIAREYTEKWHHQMSSRQNFLN
ncbi:MAG: hypothetical protein WKG06_32810 [Segetibacter sp.]